MNGLTLEMIEEAHSLIQSKLLKTPCLYSPYLSNLLGNDVYLKLEFLQITGSFKPRGALFSLSKLTPEQQLKGVITCSAGNHGKAVAYVGKLLGIKSKVYVPKNVDQAKFDGIVSYGAEVIRSPYIGYDDTEVMAKTAARDTDTPFITPFDDDQTMAANGGTIAKEILDELPNTQTFIVPVGGGGLAAGLSYYVKELNPQAEVIGCQHIDSPALKLSLEQQRAITSLPAIDTIAGGIEGGIGANCFSYLQKRIDSVELATEEELKKGLLWMLDQTQFLIEPSSAAPLACVLTNKIKRVSGPVCIVLTGRNVSLATLKNLLDSSTKP